MWKGLLCSLLVVGTAAVGTRWRRLNPSDMAAETAYLAVGENDIGIERGWRNVAAGISFVCSVVVRPHAMVLRSMDFVAFSQSPVVAKDDLLAAGAVVALHALLRCMVQLVNGDVALLLL